MEYISSIEPTTNCSICNSGRRGDRIEPAQIPNAIPWTDEGTASCPLNYGLVLFHLECFVDVDRMDVDSTEKDSGPSFFLVSARSVLSSDNELFIGALDK